MNRNLDNYVYNPHKPFPVDDNGEPFELEDYPFDLLVAYLNNTAIITQRYTLQDAHNQFARDFNCGAYKKRCLNDRSPEERVILSPKS